MQALHVAVCPSSEEIAAALPEIDPAKACRKMAEIDGVLVIRDGLREPASIARLREELEQSAPGSLTPVFREGQTGDPRAVAGAG